MIWPRCLRGRSLGRALFSTAAPRPQPPQTVPIMLQTMRVCLGQGKRLDSILDSRADQWAPPSAQPHQVRPIGRLLARLLLLDHLDEAQGVMRWMLDHAAAGRQPTHAEFLVMLRGLNARGSSDTARLALELYELNRGMEQRSGLDETVEGRARIHVARREAVCALGALGRFSEALDHLEAIRVEGLGGAGRVRRLRDPAATARAQRPRGPTGWPGLDEEIVYYSSLLRLLDEQPKAAAVAGGTGHGPEQPEARRRRQLLEHGRAVRGRGAAERVAPLSDSVGETHDSGAGATEGGPEARGDPGAARRGGEEVEVRV